MHRKVNFRTFVLIFILAGIYIFIFSESGVIERKELSKKYNKLSEKVDYIKNNNLKLSKECEKLKSGNYSDRDIISSGFVYKTGKFIYISDNEKEKTSGSRSIQDEFIITPEHLRIIWLLVSMMILTYNFLKNNKSDDLDNGSDFN